MRNHFFSFFPLILILGCKSEFDTLGVKLKIDQKKLSNGLQVILIEDPTVPRFIPPFAMGLVRKSPNVAPNGLVKTKANQKSNVPETFVKKCSRIIIISNAVIKIALF